VPRDTRQAVESMLKALALLSTRRFALPLCPLRKRPGTQIRANRIDSISSLLVHQPACTGCQANNLNVPEQGAYFFAPFKPLYP